MRPIETSCPYASPTGENCAAQAGKPCRRWDDVRQQFSVWPGHFHAERQASAAALSVEGGAPPSEEAFNQAVESLGIV